MGLWPVIAKALHSLRFFWESLFHWQLTIIAVEAEGWHKPLACGHADHRPEAYATLKLRVSP